MVNDTYFCYSLAKYFAVTDIPIAQSVVSDEDSGSSAVGAIVGVMVTLLILIIIIVVVILLLL